MSDRWEPGSPPIDPATFSDLIAGEPCVVVHFWAEWNGHDRQMDRVLQPIREEFADRVTFRSADIDSPALVPLCRSCKVSNIPSLACFVRGKRVWTLVGVRTSAEWRRLIAESLASPGDRESPKSSGSGGSRAKDG